MTITAANVAMLVDEFETYIAESRPSGSDIEHINLEALQDRLCRHGEFSPAAAAALVALAQTYGSFVLRNALALSIALGIEDGDCGL